MAERPKIKQKPKGKPRNPLTRLWHVCLVLEASGTVILVSADPISESCIDSRRIRSITAKAAGRRYARNNVETALAGVRFETDEPTSVHYKGMTRAMVKQFKGEGRHTPIRVVADRA